MNIYTKLLKCNVFFNHWILNFFNKINIIMKYLIFARLLNIIQNTKYPVSYLEILKTILNIVESIKYDYDENMNTVLKCLFNGNIFTIF
jgi:hypothetical protein